MTNGMFDDLVLKAKDLADAASKKTGEFYEISKYKCECIKLNGELKKLYEQLGSSVYSMVKNGYDNDELVHSLTEEIDERMDRLKEITALIDEIKDYITCPVCKCKNGLDSSYCNKCGSKLNPAGKAPAAEEASDDCCGECCGCTEEANAEEAPKTEE